MTSSRLPYAVTEIRALGGAGHEIHAADTFALAPGSHSRFVARAHVTAPPRRNPIRYHEQIESIVEEHGIDLIVPAFEEVFYLARQGRRIGGAWLDAPDFEVLRRLHDKRTFASLARELGLRVPETIVAATQDDLRLAICEFDQYFARPAFSRAGTSLLTNVGELAGEMTVEDCEPSAINPWIVQPCIEGLAVCGFSVVRAGRVTAQASYVHPRTLDGGGGVVFESIVEPAALVAAQVIADAMAYHGQLSLDFIRTDSGELYCIECNPRPTAGVCLMPLAMFVAALADEPLRPLVAPAGVRRMFRGALIRDMIKHPGTIPSALREIFFTKTRDVLSERGDRWPGFFRFLSGTHALQHMISDGQWGDKLALSYLHDVCWDGDPIPRRDAAWAVPVPQAAN